MYASPDHTIRHDTRRRVLVTGANGYVGSAVSRAFVRAGWKTYGLVRRPELALSLSLLEIIPIVGDITDPELVEALGTASKTWDCIASCTDHTTGYSQHFVDVVALFRTIADTSNAYGRRPLVLWTSGSKDYGTTDLHGALGVAPHTETSPLNGPDFLRQRIESSIKIFEHEAVFDAALLRPTMLIGYSSGYFGAAFDFVSQVAASGSKVLSIPGHPDTIMHSTHVDDCAEAYVLLAEHKTRQQVAGQCFNIAGRQYETLSEIASALAEAYGMPGGVEFVSPMQASVPVALMLGLSFSQWVGSDRIRSLTRWQDKRPLLTEDPNLYKMAYEAALERGDETIQRVRTVFQKRADQVQSTTTSGV